MRHHDIRHAHEAKNIGTRVQITTSVKLGCRSLDISVDSCDFRLEFLVRSACSQRVNNARGRQGHIVRSVEHAAFLESLASIGSDGRVTAFHNALAAIVGQLIHVILVDFVHGTAGEAQIARNIENILGIIEFRRSTANDVAAKQGATFVLDFGNGLQSCFRNTIGFVDVTTGVRECQGNGAVFQQLFRQGACYLAATENQTAFAFERVILVFKDFIREMGDTETGGL